jgi:hypothetical protein
LCMANSYNDIMHFIYCVNLLKKINTHTELNLQWPSHHGYLKRGCVLLQRNRCTKK